MSDHADTSAGPEPSGDERRAEPEGPEEPAGDERVAEGVDHLQVAAREMIAAARTFLDVAEELVRDRAAVASVAELLGSVGQVVKGAASRLDTDRTTGTDDQPAADGDDPPPSRVQHIDLS
jgi:hypothetical protein